MNIIMDRLSINTSFRGYMMAAVDPNSSANIHNIIKKIDQFTAQEKVAQKKGRFSSTPPLSADSVSKIIQDLGIGKEDITPESAKKLIEDLKHKASYLRSNAKNSLLPNKLFPKKDTLRLADNLDAIRSGLEPTAMAKRFCADITQMLSEEFSEPPEVFNDLMQQKRHEFGKAAEEVTGRGISNFLKEMPTLYKNIKEYIPFITNYDLINVYNKLENLNSFYYVPVNYLGRNHYFKDENNNIHKDHHIDEFGELINAITAEMSKRKIQA